MLTTQITNEELAKEREQLLKKKEQLIKNLNEVTETLKYFDDIVKGKFEKAIHLLKEVLDYRTYPPIYVKCEECDEDIEVDLDTVIYELENLCRLEFEENE